jgi:hypothetical protein
MVAMPTTGAFLPRISLRGSVHAVLNTDVTVAACSPRAEPTAAYGVADGELLGASLRKAARLLIRLAHHQCDAVSSRSIVLLQAGLDEIIRGQQIIASLENRARGVFGRNDAFRCALAQFFGSAEMIHH